MQGAVPILPQQWDTGYLITAWISGIIGIIAILCIIGGVVQFFRNEDGFGGMVSGCGAIIFLVCIVTFLVNAWPFSSVYHRYQPEQGIVTAISSRFVASGTQGGGSDQKFVVTFQNGTSWGVLDTRASLIKVGDTLGLECEKVYQFNAPSPGFDCNWGYDKKPNGTVIP